MAATDAGGAHTVSWAANNAEMRARLGTCLACGMPIFTRAVADAPLVEGSFRKPYYFTACPARLAINNYKAAITRKRSLENSASNDISQHGQGDLKLYKIILGFNCLNRKVGHWPIT